jgi:hypothetical protein
MFNILDDRRSRRGFVRIAQVNRVVVDASQGSSKREQGLTMDAINPPLSYWERCQHLGAIDVGRTGTVPYDIGTYQPLLFGPHSLTEVLETFGRFFATCTHDSIRAFAYEGDQSASRSETRRTRR